ncbi:hypothetical protein HY489_03755 [Candidatus Woesearchaeota archaeon]|nr:hypothetical protein [Candidatus Woesearchaeota archaeon]
MGKKKLDTIHQLTHKVGDFLKEAVKAPEKPIHSEETHELEETDQNNSWEEIRKHQELPEEVDEIEDEPIEEPPEISNDVLDNLNQATQQWKQTGDSGIHLEAPVPFTERARAVWQKIAKQSPIIGAAIKNQIENVAARATARLKTIKPQIPPAKQDTQTVSQSTQQFTKLSPPQTTVHTPATPPLKKPVQPQTTAQKIPPRPQQPRSQPAKEDIERAILEEWKQVIQKADPHADREEIENIYKQLSQ